MDPSEIQRIGENLPALLRNTKCSDLLLAGLEQAGVLHPEDVEEICAKPTPTGQARRLYEILVTRSGAFSALIQSLEDTRQSGAVHILKYGDSPSSSSSSRSADAGIPNSGQGHSVNVRAPLPTFTGRANELEYLHATLTRDPSGDTNPNRIVTITGMGGIGKTQLCRRYVQLHADYYSKNVIWLNGESEAKLSSQFLAFAQNKLKLNPASTKTKVNEELVHDVFNLFRTRRRKCLVVLDNVEKGDHLRNYLPPSTGFPDDWTNIHFLLTSRIAIWGHQFNPIQLQLLEPSEATEMVLKIIGSPSSGSERDLCLQLVNLLQRLPLALHQAAALIREERTKGLNFGILAYLAEYREHQESCLSFLDSEGCTLEFNDYNGTILTTWQISIEKISMDAECGELAVEVLEATAYLCPDSITTNGLSAIFIMEKDKLLRAAFALLLRYSLVTIPEGQPFWSVHRLVQEVMRIRVRRSSGAEAQILKRLLGSLQSNVRLHLENISQVLLFACASSDDELLLSEFSHLEGAIATEVLVSGRASCLNKVQMQNTSRFPHNSNSGGLEIIDRFESSNLPGLSNLVRVLGALNGTFDYRQWAGLLDAQLASLTNHDFLLYVIRSKSACTIKSLEGLSPKCSSDLPTFKFTSAVLALLHLQCCDLGKAVECCLKIVTGTRIEDRLSRSCLLSFDFLSNYFDLLLPKLSRCLVRKASVFEKLFGNGVGVPIMLELYGALGTALSVHGYHPAALEILDYTLGRQQLETSQHRDSLYTIVRLAHAHLLMGNLEEARNMFSFVQHQSLIECGGENSELMLEAKLGISEVLSCEGKYQEALTFLEQLHTDLTVRFGMTEEYYVQMVNILRGKAMKHLGLYENCLQLYSSVPEHFGERIGWQFLRKNGSLAKEINEVKWEIKRERLLRRIRRFFFGYSEG